MKYVDVMLPLPLDSLFSYSVPVSLDGDVGRGRRVVVPFGRSKTYVGLIVSVHENKPEFKTKDIKQVLDVSPVITELQFRLWRWLSDYYIAAAGDVMNAALPAGLKGEEAYRPKTEVYVALAENLRSQLALQTAVNKIGRAENQKKVFNTFLSLSHWNGILTSAVENEVVEVSRDELMNEAHCTSMIFRNLVVRKYLTTYEREVGRINDGGEAHPENIKPLSEAQREAYNNILFAHLRRDVVLLHGVTSSGKTEIYIHLIQQAIERKQQVLYLLPEIALTVQIRQRLKRVFGNRLGIYHSKYSDAERVEIWKKQLSAEPYSVILGARSAVLLPFTNLGLVIIDEEHETSFKQQDPAPRYHARSAAIVLAKMAGAKVLLGSATPSVESLYNAKIGKYGLVTLTKRYSDLQLPDIHVIDVKDLLRRKMMNGPFSPQLLSAVRAALDKREQVILFQNRRGFAPMVECRQCGWVPHCKQCDVSLTYHKSLNELTCHYCGTSYAVPEVCPCCGSRNLRGRGYGTEKVEDKVNELFPDARVARMDLDTTHTRNAYERIINEFSEHKTDILIGTQMVSKGLDFDKVSVVGILDADSMLNYPDFRAYEHAFMMMSQVAGRAGRKGRRGLVMLQTKSAQLPVISQVVRNDMAEFFEEQLEERRMFNYPPYCRLVYAYLKHREDACVEAAALSFADLLRSWFGSRVLGPDKPSVSKVKTLNIRKIVIKLENGIDLAKARLYLRKGRQVMSQSAAHRGVQIYFDVDPM